MSKILNFLHMFANIVINLSLYACVERKVTEKIVTVLKMNKKFNKIKEIIISYKKINYLNYNIQFRKIHRSNLFWDIKNIPQNLKKYR